jgi:hypothetical protein
MKLKILKLYALVLLLIFIGASCQKDEFDHADENMEISSIPGISIYKTNNDYFNNISVQITEEGQINAIPDYIESDPRIIVDNNGTVRVNFRWRLRNGYIVDKEVFLNAAFTDISIQEYVDWNTKNNVAGWPASSIEPRISNKNPFTEFFYFDGMNKSERIFTIGEINKMIESGTLETVFTRLK